MLLQGVNFICLGLDEMTKRKKLSFRQVKVSFPLLKTRLLRYVNMNIKLQVLASRRPDGVCDPWS